MPTRGPYAKTPARRAEILDAALGLIAEHGYGTVTIQQIADTVGLTKAGVLHHFGSREELLLAVLERRDELDRMQNEHGVIRGFVEIIRHNVAVPGLVALYAALAGEPASDPLRRAFFERRYAGAMDPMVDAVRREQLAGRIRSELDPVTVTRALFALADGLQTQWLLDERIDMAADIETFLSLLRPEPERAPSWPSEPGGPTESGERGAPTVRGDDASGGQEA